MDDPRYTKRADLLQEAKRIITQDRNKTYGEPDEDFQRIAAIATAWGFRVDTGAGTGRHLSGTDVAVFMICLKLARLSWMPSHRDSWMDIAGYAGCGYETAALEKERAGDSLVPLVAMGMMEVPAKIREAAERAEGGNPKDLEDLGYMLGNSNPPLDGCSRLCTGGSLGHTYRPGCQYRIRRRRVDA